MLWSPPQTMMIRTSSATDGSSEPSRASGRFLDRLPPAEYASAEEIEEPLRWPNSDRIDQRFREIRAQLVDANARELRTPAQSTAYFSDITFEEKGVAGTSAVDGNAGQRSLVVRNEAGDIPAARNGPPPAVADEERDSADAIRRLYDAIAGNVARIGEATTPKPLYHGLVPSPRVGLANPSAAPATLSIAQPTTSKGPIRAISSPPHSSASAAAESVHTARSAVSSQGGGGSAGVERESGGDDSSLDRVASSDDDSMIDENPPASYRTTPRGAASRRQQRHREKASSANKGRGKYRDDDANGEVVETLYSVSLVTGKSIDELRAVNPHIADFDPHQPLPIGTRLKICRKKSNLSPERHSTPSSGRRIGGGIDDNYPRISQHASVIPGDRVATTNRSVARTKREDAAVSGGVSVRQIALLLSLPVTAVWRKVPHFRAYNEDETIDQADLDGVVIDGVPLVEYLESPALAPARLAAQQQQQMEARSVEDERQDQINRFVHRHPSKTKTMTVDERDRLSLRSIASTIARCHISVIKDLNPELASLFEVDDFLPHATPVCIPADAKIVYRSDAPETTAKVAAASAQEKTGGDVSSFANNSNANMFSDVMQRRSASAVSKQNTVSVAPSEAPSDDAVDPLLYVTPGPIMGQSLSEIAWSLGISVDEIREQNPFTFQYSSHATLPTTCRLKLPKSILWESEPIVSPPVPGAKSAPAFGELRNTASRYRRTTPPATALSTMATAKNAMPGPPPPSPALSPAAPTGPPTVQQRQQQQQQLSRHSSESSLLPATDHETHSARVALVSYTTKRGDTIQRIAKDFAVHPDVVYEHNSAALLLGPEGVIHYQDTLAPGQQLLLPDVTL